MTINDRFEQARAAKTLGPQLVHSAAVAPTAPPPGRDHLIRLAEVESIAGVRKSTIYQLMKEQPPRFPLSIQITPRCVAWSARAIYAWVQQRIEEAEATRRPGATSAPQQSGATSPATSGTGTSNATGGE